MVPIGRDGFALTGPSARLDPRTHAVRGDLADVRLADRVFAPHYAAPIACVVARATVLADARVDATALAPLIAGDVFEVLELSGDLAWGIAPGHRLVGYCDRTALACTAAA